jgi:two-component system, NarL family, nitrate/nitrite response regulator NarL
MGGEDATRPTRNPDAGSRGACTGGDLPLRVFIVENVRLLREAFADFLKKHPSVDVVGADAACSSMPSAVAHMTPDVTLINASVAGSVAAVRALAAAAPMTKLLAIGLPETELELVAHVEAGISGYVKADAGIDELLLTMRAVMKGEMAIPAQISSVLLRRLATLAKDQLRQTPLSRLTPRESEVALLISEGLSNKEIAKRLSIELRTVKNHVHAILDKFGVSSRSAVTRVVLEAEDERRRAE